MLGNLKAAKRFTFGRDKTWAEVATVTAVEQSVNAPGAVAGRFYLIQKPTYQANLAYIPVARCDSDGVLKVQFSNNTAGGLTPTAAEAWVGVCLDLEIDPSQTSAST
jgi:hypothetical protein